jgi:hypothetical protein
LRIEAEHGLIGRITVPFAAPEEYHRPDFGCPVVRGDHFTVQCCDGNLLINPK